MKAADFHDKKLGSVNHRRPHDKKNCFVINMTVKNDDAFLSPFSESDTPVISPEVAAFIEHRAELSLPGEKFVLHIKSDCIDDAEKKIYREAIREYYFQQYLANDRELKHTRKTACCMCILGLFVLALAVFIEYQFGSMVGAEFIDIVAWVLLWEGVYRELFDNRKRRLNKNRYFSCLSMEVLFTSIDTPKHKITND